MTVTVPQHLGNVVDGRLVDSAQDATDPVVNPSTGETLALCPQGSAEDVTRAISAARTALRAWSRTTPAARAGYLLELANALEARAQEFIALESADVGKPAASSAGEFPLHVDHLRFFAGAARVLEGTAAGEYVEGYTSIIRREPIGVVGQITPWNYPLSMAVMKIAPALAAGNTVVLKPSEMTPLTTLRLAQLAQEILPAGVLNVVLGRGASVGRALVSDPAVAMIALTGSVQTGKAVAAIAAEHLARVHLELGGNAPVIVCDDADLDAVVRGIRVGGFYNAGQDCTAAARIIATAGAYDALVERLVPAVASLVVGEADQDGVELGPVISERQRERVIGFVERAAADGAEVATGGARTGSRGSFVEPTVLLGAQQRSEVVQSEVFGPVVTVQRAQSAAQAVEWANDTVYGLASSVWTRDASSFLNISRELNFGVVWLNDHLPFLSEMPHGGFGQSGYGKDLSHYALEEYTRVKHVMASLA
jgi:1-pyrroline dehydrogenase